jgi:hypothetical protein
MSPRAARRLLVAFFVLYTIALTYPGALVANRIEPLVFGLPFIMFWVVLWVVLSLPVFILLDRAHKADADRTRARDTLDSNLR